MEPRKGGEMSPDRTWKLLVRAKDGIVCAKIGRYGSGCVVRCQRQGKRITAQPTTRLRQVNSSVIVDEAFADRET